MRQFRWLTLPLLCCTLIVTCLISLASFHSSKKVFPQDLNYPEELPIVVVIPSYKNKDWYERNLESIFIQNYHNYRVIFIDDASPDGTGKLAKAYVKEKGQQERVTLLLNSTRVGALANLYKAIWMCSPQEIVVTLDGDDWFSNENVLSKLNEVYSREDVWLTYGQFAFYPEGSRGWASQVPDDIIRNNAFREYPWCTTHLRTFYAGLFHKIKIDDLLHEGEFYPMAWDLAMMWPMLEMSGWHSRFIPDVLYIYNISTMLNDIKVDPTFQQNLGFTTRWKPKYTPIERPYD